MGNTILDNNQASTYLLPVSDISISEIFKNVNPKDRKHLKYIPNQFLNEEQIKAKRLALREDDIKFGRTEKVSAIYIIFTNISDEFKSDKRFCDILNTLKNA